MAFHKKSTSAGEDGGLGFYKVKPKKEWGNGLGKRTAKNSVRTVFFNFKEYLSFFVALFIIQSMFWLICFTTSTNVNHRYNVITSEYDYDMIIEGIDGAELAGIENALNIKSYQRVRGYESYELIPPDQYHDYYTLKAEFKLGQSSLLFLKFYIEDSGVGEENVKISYTPRYMFMERYVNEALEAGILSAIFLTALSVVLLMALYNIRLNHFKFLYGVYMTCGAGFRKLFSTAVWEMLVISATTLAASFGTVCLTVSLLYRFAGIPRVYITSWMIPAVILLNLLTAYFAVRAPMKRMSKKAPLSLIVAQDNSNLVSSPRRSFRIFGKSFPYHYELYSTWRFRKYFAGMLLVSITFAALFICGIYLANMNKSELESAAADAYIKVDYWDLRQGSDFEIDDAVDLMDEIMVDQIESVEGVRYAHWENSESATAIVSHILIPSENLTGNASYTARAKTIDGFDLATNHVKYSAFDRHYIDRICNTYEVEGDPYAILDDSQKIIISETIYNTRNFKFSPGDKIYAARFLYKTDKFKENYFDQTYMLRQYLENCVFDYKEYEVAAVIRGYKDEGELILGMNPAEYLRRTGKSSLNKNITVSLSSGIKQSEADRILEKININLVSFLRAFGIEHDITNNYVSLRKQLEAEGVSYPAIIAISIMLLMVSPIVWLFSQVLFYLKREKEIGLLSMFGASERQLTNVYTFAGLIMAVLAIVFTLLLSVATSYIVYKLLASLLPSIGFKSFSSVGFSISGIALLVCLLVSAACGFVSAYIPYKISKKRRDRDHAASLSGRS